VVFDKTGTLTRGQFDVADMAAAQSQDEDEALALAAALEADSEHPIAAGIRRSAEERGVGKVESSGFGAMKGRGVTARSGGEEIFLGGPRLLEMLEVTPSERIAELEEQVREKGQTLVYLVQARQVMAAFALADVVRPESHEAVEQLHAMGIEVAMLTGDAEQVARTVAEELGIDRYFAEVLPSTRTRRSPSCSALASMSLWSATASTTHPPSLPPTSASPSAPTSPLSRPTSSS
jgi:Cu2+-exporting ATPase